MQIVWRLRKGSVRDILEKFREPKPKCSTISTITRIPEGKDFVGLTVVRRT